MLGADVDDAGVVGGEDNGSVPLVALGRLSGGLFFVRVAHGEVAHFTRVQVHPAASAELAFEVDVLGIPPVAKHIVAVARGEIGPVRRENPIGIAILRRAHPTAVVLGPAHDVVGHEVVHGDIIELLGADRFLLGPVFTAVPGFTDASVVTVQDVIGVERIDPHPAGVHMALLGAVPGSVFESFAAVFGFFNTDFHRVQNVGIVGINIDPSGITGLDVVDLCAASDDGVFRHFFPGLAHVIRAVDHTVALHGLDFLKEPAVKQVQDVAVDDLIAAFGFAVLFITFRLGHVEHSFHSIHHLQDVRVVFVNLTGSLSESGQVDSDVGLEFFAADEFIQLVGQFRFILGLDRRKFDHSSQFRVDFERLEFVEIGPVLEQRASGPEVGPVFPQIKSQINLLIHADINDVGIFRINGQAVPAGFDIHGQAVRQLVPGQTAVRGFVEVVSGLLVDKGPTPPVGLVTGSEDDIGIGGMKNEVAHPPVLEIEDLVPGLSSIRCLEQAAQAGHVVVVQFPLAGDIDDVGIFVVHSDTRNIVAFVQPDERPSFTGIDRLPHPVAVGGRTGVHGLPGSYIDDVGIGRRHFDVSDAHVPVIVKNGGKGDAAVFRFPDPAGSRGRIIDLALARGNSKVRDPA